MRNSTVEYGYNNNLRDFFSHIRTLVKMIAPITSGEYETKSWSSEKIGVFFVDNRTLTTVFDCVERSVYKIGIRDQCIYLKIFEKDDLVENNFQLSALYPISM